MVNRRITLSISDEDWSNLHVMRLLLTIGNPYINQIPNYGDITRLSILESFYSVSLNKPIEDEFINEKHEYVKRITIAGFTREYASFMDEWKEKSTKRKNRLLVASVIPRGNFVYTADNLDLAIISYLRGVMRSKGFKEQEATDAKIIKKCIRFLFNSPVYLYDTFAKALISSVYGLRVYYTTLKEISIEEPKVIRILNDGLSGGIIETPHEIKALYSLSKDSRVLVEFLRNILSMKDLTFDSLNVVKGKYWSTIGFDFLEMLIGMAISLRLLFRQDEWVPDIVINRDFNSLDLDVLLLFLDEMSMLLEHTKTYSDLYDKVSENSLEKIAEEIANKFHS